MSDPDDLPVYTAAAPKVPSSDELRARIPGWGVDLDPANRPSYPREKSIEHEILPPVFGTTLPLRGLSGRMRRYSYRRFSEARTAHWLLLLAADRVDVLEHRLASVGRRLSGRAR